jgi:hypothetical protein
MKIVLATGSDERYLTKIRPYLKSIEFKSNFDLNYLVYVSDAPTNLSLPFSKIKIGNLLLNSFRAPNSINCAQHGDFLYCPELDSDTNDDDIIIYTDGDMIIQRRLSKKEIEFLRSMRDGDIYVGYNASPDDTLANEFKRLGKTGKFHEEFELDLDKHKVYNTGVLAMNKRTWKKVIDIYSGLYPKIDEMLTHYAKQQWLLCFIFATNNFNIFEMPYHIHNHTHYPSPKGTSQDSNGLVFFNKKLVLFKHRW